MNADMEKAAAAPAASDKAAGGGPALSTRDNVVQAAKFVAFSCSAGAIQALTFTLLNEIAGLPYRFCYLPALVLSVLYNFTVNRRFTFKSAANVPVAMLKVAAYYAVFTPVSTWLGHIAEAARINEYLILFVTMVCNLVTEFLVCRFFVFGGSINTNEAARKAAAKAGAAAADAAGKR